jgi:hypothetical protein
MLAESAMKLRTDFSCSAMTFPRIVILLNLFELSMISSEKPVPDFPDHALVNSEYRPCEAGPQADRVPILTIDYR